MAEADSRLRPARSPFMTPVLSTVSRSEDGQGSLTPGSRPVTAQSNLFAGCMLEAWRLKSRRLLSAHVVIRSATGVLNFNSFFSCQTKLVVILKNTLMKVAKTKRPLASLLAIGNGCWPAHVWAVRCAFFWILRLGRFHHGTNITLFGLSFRSRKASWTNSVGRVGAKGSWFLG
jgi:hypothetical protein